MSYLLARYKMTDYDRVNFGGLIIFSRAYAKLVVKLLQLRIPIFHFFLKLERPEINRTLEEYNRLRLLVTL